MSIDESFLQGLQAPLQVPQADLPIDMTPYVTALADVKSHEAKIKQLERMQEYSDNLAAKLKKETQDAEYDFEERGLKMAYVSSNPWIRRQWLEKVAEEPLMSEAPRDDVYSYYDPNEESQSSNTDFPYPTVDSLAAQARENVARNPNVEAAIKVPSIPNFLGGFDSDFLQRYSPQANAKPNPLDAPGVAAYFDNIRRESAAKQSLLPRTQAPRALSPTTSSVPQTQAPQRVEQGPATTGNALDFRLFNPFGKFDPKALRTAQATQQQQQSVTSETPPAAGVISSYRDPVDNVSQSLPPKDILYSAPPQQQQQLSSQALQTQSTSAPLEAPTATTQPQPQQQQRLNQERDSLLRTLDPRPGASNLRLPDQTNLPIYPVLDNYNFGGINKTDEANKFNRFKVDRQRRQLAVLANPAEPATQQQVKSLRELSGTATKQRDLLDLRNRFTRGQVSEAELNNMLEQGVNPGIDTRVTKAEIDRLTQRGIDPKSLGIQVDSSTGEGTRDLTYGNLRQKAIENRQNFSARARGTLDPERVNNMSVLEKLTRTQDPKRLKNLQAQGFTLQGGLDKGMYPTLRSPIQRRINELGIQNTTPQELRQQVATGTLNPSDLEAAYQYYQSPDFAPVSTNRDAANIDQFANMLNARQSANTQAARGLQNRLNNPTLLQSLQDNMPYFSERDELQKKYDVLKNTGFTGDTDTPFGRFESEAQEDARDFKELGEDFKRQEEREAARIDEALARRAQESGDNYMRQRDQSLAPLRPTIDNIKLLQRVRQNQAQKPAAEQNYGEYFRGLPSRIADLGYDMVRPITTGAQQLASYALENPNLRGLVDQEQRDLINAGLYRSTGDDIYKDRYVRSVLEGRGEIAGEIDKLEEELRGLDEKYNVSGTSEDMERRDSAQRRLEQLQQQLNSPSLVGEGSDQAFYGATLRPQMAFMNDLLGTPGANTDSLNKYKGTTEKLLRDAAERYYQNPTYNPYREARTIAGNLVTNPQSTLRELALGLDKNNPITPYAQDATAPEDVETRLKEEGVSEADKYLAQEELDKSNYLTTGALEKLESLDNPQLVADIIKQYNPRVMDIMNKLTKAKTVDEQQAIMDSLGEADIAELTKQLSLLKGLFPAPQ